MKIRKQLLPFIVAFVIVCIAIVELIYFFDPAHKIEVYTFLIDPVIVFYLLVFLAGYLLFTFIFLNSIKGTLFSLFVVGALLLRMLGYFNWSYLALLSLIIILSIFLFPKRLRSAVKHLRTSSSKSKI